jgi:hypothetical protein
MGEIHKGHGRMARTKKWSEENLANLKQMLSANWVVNEIDN